ncbi:19861_t:CDS:1, partial [Racocetra fulgida]
LFDILVVDEFKEGIGVEVELVKRTAVKFVKGECVKIELVEDDVIECKCVEDEAVKGKYVEVELVEGNA